MPTPTIETPRLLLRGHRLDDFAALSAMWSDLKVTQHILGRAATQQESWTRLLRYVGHWALLGFGYWAITEKDSGRFVGEAGFADFKRELDPPLDGIPEIGWALTAAVHGKGYATEAVQAAVQWGDQHLASRRTVCMIDPANVASLRVAAKCGYRQYAETVFMGGPSLLFERFSPKV